MDESISRQALIKPRSGSRMDRLFRRQVLRRLDKVQGGRLMIVDRWSSDRKTSTAGSPGSLDCRVVVHDPVFWRMLATGGSLGAGEAYMAGVWDCEDLTGLVRLFARNRSLLETMDGGLARLTGAMLRVWHGFNRNSLRGSRNNIAAHYDLSNDFFASWLDSRMMYSSAVYETGRESLEEAQEIKLDRICRRLDLRPTDHLVEIGTGWGGLAIHAASNYGCRVTTTTISRAQFDLAARRIRQAGLEDRITLLLEDYRALDGCYDKLVSVEMVEAVGHQYLDTWFAKLQSLLKPDGLGLIQAITIEDYRYARALKTVDFIKRYIFPGSFIPSVSAITGSMARVTDFSAIGLEDIGPSYGLTLKAWRERFEAAWPEIQAQGFDEGFRRRWRFYLAYCEGGFLERAISDIHLLIARPGYSTAGWQPPE